MKKKAYSGFTKKTPERLLLDAGAFFKDFIYKEDGKENDTFETAVKAGKLIGATKGGGEFSAVPTVRQIEADGVKGRAKGLEIIDSWDVYLKATVLEVTAETIKSALGAATVDTLDEKYDVITGNASIELTDYLDNVTWVGTLSGSNEPVIIQVYNGLNTDGLKLTVQDRNEATIPMTFYGHYTDDDLDSPPFRVLYPKKEAGQTPANPEGSEEQNPTNPEKQN